MQRLPLYAEAAERLLAADKAYPCYCTPEELDADRKAQEAAKQPPRYVGRCARLTAEERAAREAEGRPAALRFRVGEGVVAFDDIVRGRVEIDVANLGGDFVIVRGDGTPLYHFTVVVDDAAMEISHVIRGEDHLSNTPKHILLFRALGYPEPQFAHLPLILNADRTKMSKRKSQTAVVRLHRRGLHPRGAGQLPGAARLGDRHRGGGPVARRDRRALRARPTSTRAAPSSTASGSNGSTASGSGGSSPDDLVDRLRPFVEAELAAGRIDRMPSDDELRALLPIISERLPTLGAVGDLVGFLWLEDLSYEPGPARPEALGRRHDARGARRPPARSSPRSARSSFEADELEPPLRALAEARGWKAGDLFMAIRVAVTGRTATPPLFDTLVALGIDRTLERLDRAIVDLDRRDLMRRDDVQIWLDRYIAAWSSYDETAIGDLFAEDAEYRYHPWADPVVGRAAIVADWLEDKDEPGSWAAHYDVWSFDGERADADRRDPLHEPRRLVPDALLQPLRAALRWARQVRRVRRVLHGAAGAVARRPLSRPSPIAAPPGPPIRRERAVNIRRYPERQMARTILVVDDEPTLREALVDALEADGFRVVAAADGREALIQFRAERPDLVLLDLMLPELSGIEVCRIIRAESGVPIVMLTAKDSELDKVVGLELGADDYVTKPFSLRELTRPDPRALPPLGPGRGGRRSAGGRRPRIGPGRSRRPSPAARRRGRRRSSRRRSSCSPS